MNWDLAATMKSGLFVSLDLSQVVLWRHPHTILTIDSIPDLLDEALLSCDEQF